MNNITNSNRPIAGLTPSRRRLSGDKQRDPLGASRGDRRLMVLSSKYN